ncbi:MAG: hypothetical protein ACXVJD_01985 [Mucilaginibacter sp.]
MKKAATLIILLSLCFKLHAVVCSTDTNKTTSADTVKLLAAAGQSDNFNFSASDNPKHIFSLKAGKNYAEGSVPALNKNSFSLQAVIPDYDHLNFASLEKQADSINSTDPRLADSLRLLASLVRQDSIKVITYRKFSDSVKRQLAAMSTDSLKLQLKDPANDLFKGHIYNEMALRYLAFDTLSNKMTRASYQNKALNYTMLALHQFSYFNDTTGLRISFDHLTKIYMAQKKYSQAKWFILQSNTLSRLKKDPLNVITSLITLAEIKSDINDNTLAMRDLNEAMSIATANHYQKAELQVLKSYAMLYSRLKNYPKEALVLKKRDSLEESIRKAEEAKMMASLATKDSLEKTKADSVQSKKKALSSNIRKLYKSNSARKIASL